MITKDSIGNNLSSQFTTQLQQRALGENRGPVNQILFARKIQDTWYKRDVSGIFMNSMPINKSIAENYGTSKGTEVQLVFDNSPLPVLHEIRSKEIFAVVRNPRFHLQANDWVEISDFNNVEHRRIAEIIPIDSLTSSVRFSVPLDSDFAIDYTEIRFLFAIEDFKNRLDSIDFYNGYVQMNLGFANIDNQYLTLYQGEITGAQREPNSTIALVTQDKVKALIETQLSARFEVDDRGVASVPTPRGWNNENTIKDFGRLAIPDISPLPNSGTGKCSDIVYSENKTQEVSDNDWTLTYHEDRWYVYGVPFGTDLDEGHSATGDTGSRRWEIDLRDLAGWSVTINEGDIPFVDGDQFSFFTKGYEEGKVSFVKGRGFNSNPIETLDEIYISPSYIIEFFLKNTLGIQHENINTGIATDVLVDVDSIRHLDTDFRTELRGMFAEGTSAIQVIDDALRAVNGWIYSTYDDHLTLFYYTPFSFDNQLNVIMSSDIDNPLNPSIYPNACDPQVSPRLTDSIKNQIVFTYNNGSVEVDDEESQEIFGKFKLDVRGEDLITHGISSGYEMSENTARNAAYRALQRYKNPILQVNFTGLPGLLLTEIGDIITVLSRESQLVNQPFWITGLEIDFTKLIVVITGEIATQIHGKFGVAHGTDTRSSEDVWDGTGFIGNVGEERLAYVADDDETIQLTIINPLSSGVYQTNFGKPDKWGNYSESSYIVA